MGSVRLLVVLLLALASIGFIAAIVGAVRYSRQGAAREMPPFLRLVTTTIGGVLATNLGLVVGIKVKEVQSAGFRAADILVSAGQDVPSRLQVGAAWLYILGLLIALCGWISLKFTEDPDKVVVTLPQLSQTFLGVIVGVLVVTLAT